MPSDFMTIDRGKLDNLARKGAYEIVRAITMRTAAIAAATAPGHMGQTVRPIFKGSKANPVGIVMVDHPAATYVMNGTSPHDIYPRRPGGVLRFTMGSRVVFARHVHHPGTQPNPFLWKALLAARRM